MNIILVSINHKTAPIEIREALHLSNNEIVDFIGILKQNYLLEGLILTTCNRTEILGIPKNTILIHDKIIDELINFKSVTGIKKEHFTSYFSCSAVKHFFSVAGGIDSLIIGDSQILAQVKEAVQISEENKFVSYYLNRLFDTAIRVGKRSIKETIIGEGAVSISYAAVQVVEKVFANLYTKSALIIGAGETAELAAIHLRNKGVGRITITNRTKAKAEKLADKIHGEIIPFEFFKEYLHNYDIILSATSSNGYILEYTDIKEMMKKRRYSAVCIMDIAIPRDINPITSNLDNVFYNDIDSLKMIVDQNIKKREKEIPVIENIIMEEMVNFFSWYNSLDVIPAIKNLRSFFEQIKEDELNKIRHKVTEEDFVKIEEMSKRLIGRLLHNPTLKLRQLSENGRNYEETANSILLIKEIFNLNLEDK
ncbi:MAG TPA: glutamyl-tRNA reductase [Melioribacteraceae bacterium]|nr:glutamyl-tRNA reductase [Melioribacteraceae bacterium]